MPVFHQKQIPDCVENAITYVKKYHELQSSGSLPDLCRRFLAILTIVKDGFSIDEGTNVENALYVASHNGICTDLYLPDNHDLSIADFSQRNAISMDAMTDGLKYKIQNYAFITDLTANGLKNAIHQNGLVIVGALINSNWWTDTRGNISWERADILPIRPPKTHDVTVDPSLSGHCFVLYGYDQDYFYFVNSFGSEWGEGGSGYFAVDEIPFIYEAATIIDITKEQVQALKDVTQDVAQVKQVINNIDPKSPNDSQIVAAVQQVVGVLIGIVKSIIT